MDKTTALINDLTQALTKLNEVLSLSETEVNRDSAIHRFEFTFELSWKLMASILVDQGMATTGVKNVIRQAADLGLVSDVETWFKFLESRNLTTHTYKEKLAKEIYQHIKVFPPLVDQLVTQVGKQEMG